MKFHELMLSLEGEASISCKKLDTHEHDVEFTIRHEFEGKPVVSTLTARCVPEAPEEHLWELIRKRIDIDFEMHRNGEYDMFAKGDAA